jgi:methionine-rich copper-binding protein CopC
MTPRAIRGAIMLAGVAVIMSLPTVALAVEVETDPPPGSTQPRVPERVTLTFGRPQTRSPTIEVFDPCGARADVGDTSVSGRRVAVELDATASGRYVVRYDAISATNGIPVSGRFDFRVAGVEGCAAADRPAARRPGRGIWDLPKGDFAVALGIAALIGALGGLVYAAILGPKA